MGDDRNDEFGADVSLQSDHTERKLISPPRIASLYHPRWPASRIFMGRSVRCPPLRCEGIATGFIRARGPGRLLATAPS